MDRATSPALSFDQEGRITACNDAVTDLLGTSRAALYGSTVDEDLHWRDEAGNRFTFAGIDHMVREGETIQPFRADLANVKGEFVSVLVTPYLFLGPGPLDFHIVLQLRPERRRRRTDHIAGGTETTPSREHRLRLRAAAAGKLTVREIQVLQHLAEGSSTEKIAEDLGIAINTVRSHVQSILGKLEASSRVEAVGVALRSRLI